MIVRSMSTYEVAQDGAGTSRSARLRCDGDGHGNCLLGKPLNWLCCFGRSAVRGISRLAYASRGDQVRADTDREIRAVAASHEDSLMSERNFVKIAGPREFANSPVNNQLPA
jgi:hypothetical protein